MRSVAVTLLMLSWFCCSAALAAETIFNSTTAWSTEFSRLGGEAKTIATSPVQGYPVESLLVLGAAGLTFAFDRDIRSDLASTRGHTLDRATDVGSFVGNPYMHLGVTAVAYGAGALTDSPRVLDLSTKVGEALVLTDGTAFILKEAVGRGRPGTGSTNDRFRPFSFKTDYDSLPSLHTASSFAIAHVLSRETDNLPAQIGYYTAATFVGFSRLYQDKHWASDVILGAALGELAGCAVTSFHGKKVAVAPTLSGRAPGVAVIGQF